MPPLLSPAPNPQRKSHLILVLILVNVLLFQLIFLVQLGYQSRVWSSDTSQTDVADYLSPFSQQNAFSYTSPNGKTSDVIQLHLQNPLGVPPGSPPNLPSIRDPAAAVDHVRRHYGGAGDQKHLGGFTQLDLDGVSPNLWRHMIEQYGVRSFLDIGCGRGTSSRWFYEHNATVLCVEGSQDAIQNSFLPRHLIVEHDYTRGPWWPQETFDAAWSVEFLEHVSRQYHFNYVSTLRKAALLFVTSSRWGGWHHVEVHPDDWWIRKFEAYGFRYDEQLTKQARQWAGEERGNSSNVGPNGKPYFPQHIVISLKVFVNPAVAALPQHQHLFPEHGCFREFKGSLVKEGKSPIINRPCAMPGVEGAELESVLPESFEPLPVRPEMHQRWHDLIKRSLEKE